jgi:hypothetical protein
MTVTIRSSGRCPTALVNLQRPSYCVEQACHIDEVFVFAPYRVRDFDEAVQGSEDTRVYFAETAC